MDNKYTMSLSLNVLNHLGINLYSNIPAVLSEIVANSWDADATRVDITIEGDRVTILDNGSGMSGKDINEKFLYVGYQKRNESIVSPVYERHYMGRKGIGKLSMFSIADDVDVYSRKKIDGEYETNAFSMSVEDITDKIKKNTQDINESSSYHPQVIEYNEKGINDTGTKIVLRNLKKNTSSLTSEFIKKRVARRFGIIGKEFNFRVYVNNIEVSVSDRDYFHKLNYIWYYGDDSLKYAEESKNAVIKEKRENTVVDSGKEYSISGWIGSVESSGDLKDGEDNLNKIVILVRGKLGQEDILSDYSEGGLYSKYLIGEINADFFDEDDYEDMATSNRQEFRKDDERFVALKRFIYDELKYIQGKWTELRNESGEKKAKELLPELESWLTELKGDDKKYAKKMFGKINQIVVDDNKKKEIIKYSVLAFEKLKYARHLSAIDDIDAEKFEVFKDVFVGLDEIEATLYYQIIRERIEVIRKFQEITDDNSLEKVIQNHLFNHLWLLDPSWERVEGTEYIEKNVLNALNVEFNGLTEEERAGRLDLGYRKAAGKHIIIELKRADRVIKTEEMIKQVKKYRSALSKVLVETYGNDYSYEILFVVGKPIDNMDSIDNRETVDKLMKTLNARVVYYKELIENAYQAYKEYLNANKETQPLIELFSKIDIME